VLPRRIRTDGGNATPESEPGYDLEKALGVCRAILARYERSVELEKAAEAAEARRFPK
jgi:hypothetical protein